MQAQDFICLLRSETATIVRVKAEPSTSVALWEDPVPAGFSSGQLTTLLSIANQCALCGGDGVYQARSLYAIADPNIKFNDESLCGQPQPIKLSNPEAKLEVVFSLSPNPASDWALLNINTELEFEGQLQVFDVSGKLVVSDAITLSSNEPYLLDLSSLPSGFYSFKVLNGIKILFTDKLIISK